MDQTAPQNQEVFRHICECSKISDLDCSLSLCARCNFEKKKTGGTLSISLKSKIVSQQHLVSNPLIQPGQFIQLSIKDSGVGISPELAPRIFDPYFTTKETGKGTGMGLAIVHGIIKSFDGVITCQSQVGEGTVFDILLPAREKLSKTDTQQVELISVGTEHILFIDDEKMLAEMGKLMLERLGYRVTVCTSSLDALNIFKNQPDVFDLVITDQTMPEMTGIDLARRILQIQPRLHIIICTGFSNLISEEQARSIGIKGFAFKPIAMKDLAALVRKVLDEKSNGKKK